MSRLLRWYETMIHVDCILEAFHAEHVGEHMGRRA
jgi:hypothetical protein